MCIFDSNNFEFSFAMMKYVVFRFRFGFVSEIVVQFTKLNFDSKFAVFKSKPKFIGKCVNNALCEIMKLEFEQF